MTPRQFLAVNEEQKSILLSVVIRTAQVIAALGADQLAVVSREALAAVGADLAVVVYRPVGCRRRTDCCSGSRTVM